MINHLRSTELVDAIAVSDKEKIQVLLQDPENISQVNPLGYTPLSMTVGRGDLELVMALVDRGSCKYAKFFRSYSCLFCLTKKHYEIAHFLLKNGADFSIVGCWKRTLNLLL